MVEITYMYLYTLTQCHYIVHRLSFSSQIAVKIQMLIANKCWTFSYDLK